MGDSDCGGSTEEPRGSDSLEAQDRTSITDLIEKLEADFSLPIVKLSQIALSRDHKQRAQEVKDNLTERKGKVVFIVDIDRRLYHGKVDYLGDEIYSLQTGEIFEPGNHTTGELRYIEVGALFYVDID